MQGNLEAILDTIAQIGATPTRDTIFLTIWTGFHPRLYFAQLRAGQARFAAGSGPVQQTSQPRGVVSMHPVSQRLAIHATSLRCQQTGVPIHHHGDRQNTPRLPRVRTPPCLCPKLHRMEFSA